MRLLSEMKPENKLATWAIIGKNINPLFIPDADSEAHTGIRVLEVNHNEGARSQVAGPLATVART